MIKFENGEVVVRDSDSEQMYMSSRLLDRLANKLTNLFYNSGVLDGISKGYK